MYQFLVDHAVKNVWCNPDQDNQLILSAKKITKPNGELNSFKLMNRTVILPTPGKRYHVFQVGQVQPIVLGLLPLAEAWAPEQWIKISEAMSTNKLIVNIYTTEGVNIPRFNSYYMFSNDRNLVFAVEIDSSLPIDYDQDLIYFRLYSNAFYQSNRADVINSTITCKGAKINNMQKLLDFQADVTQHRTLGGHTACYVNGLAVSTISPVTAVIGDLVEFVYDSSVKRVVTFTVNTLQSFNSILDGQQKYLLHHLFEDNDTIDYQDDIDIHIVNEGTNGTYKGLYYHRNSEDSHRMVTHRDYSLGVLHFEFIANSLMNMISQEPLDIRTFKIQVTVRNSGYYRPLIHDSNRIFELYKLSNDKILQAMIGVNSTLDVWKAENLENCAYTRLMRADYEQVNLSLVQEAYGYNGMSKVVGDTPTYTHFTSGRQTVNLPYGLQSNSTAYEYDVNGVMLGYHHHILGTNYEAFDGDCRSVETISGLGTVRPDVRFGQNNIPLPAYDNYRVYRCFINNGLPNNDWTDITGTTEYNVVNNTLVYTGEQYDQFIMVRTDATFLCYDLQLAPVNGNLSFIFAEEENRGTGFLPNTLPVPMGELDVFMNGKSLIKGLDYVVKFPKVYILNKSHLIQPALTATQQIHVRFTGFCKQDLTFENIDDFGFIEHGFLSNNSRYDIRDDKVLRITVDGLFKHKDILKFSEEHNGISVTNINNGKPYQIKDLIVPLKQLVNENTYSLRDKAILVDKRVSDYLTVKLPQPERSTVSSIPQRYQVISPFISRVVDAVTSGHISLTTIIQATTDMAVLSICSEYEHILDFDPINVDNNFDFKYVIVVPHRSLSTINVNLAQYKFLLKVVNLYSDGLVDISSFITFNT